MEHEPRNAMRHVVVDAFAKAEKELKLLGRNNTVSAQITLILDDTCEAPDQPSSRTLQRAHSMLVREENPDYQPQDVTLDILAVYLGYSSYADYAKNLEPETNMLIGTTKKGGTASMSGHLKLAVAVGLILVGLSIYVGSSLGVGAHQCMTWNGNQYEQVTCSGAEDQVALNERELLMMQKITPCRDEVRDELGHPTVYYLKTGGSIEFYSTHGLHPVTRKPLLEVSEHIATKYLQPCQ